MSKSILLTAVFTFIGFGQDSITVFDREIRGKADGVAAVELVNSTTLMLATRANVESDGSYVLRGISPGSYFVRFVGAPGRVFPSREDIPVSVGPESPKSVERPGTVSAFSLLNPPSKRAIKYLTKAQQYSEAGEPAKAIALLKSAPMDSAGAPYLHSRLGTEYLKTGQMALAEPELEEAARLAPKDSANHANLSFVYHALGRNREAEAEARRALELDGGNTRAHFMLGQVLAGNPATLNEALGHLKIARRDVPSARFLLAQVYLLTGQKTAADKEIQSFLGVASDAQRAAAENWLAMLPAK